MNVQVGGHSTGILNFSIPFQNRHLHTWLEPLDMPLDFFGCHLVCFRDVQIKSLIECATQHIFFEVYVCVCVCQNMKVQNIAHLKEKWTDRLYQDWI